MYRALCVGELRNVYKIQIGKHEGKRLFGMLRLRFIHSFIVIFHQSHQGYKICLTDKEPITVVIYTCFIKKGIGQINNRPNNLSSYLNIINIITMILASIYQKLIKQ
jgi:hypothetical protein